MYKYGICVIFYHPDNNAIERLDNYKGLFSKVFIIDNTEVPDRDLKRKLDNENNIEYYAMNKNCGISKAINLALKQAENYGIDYLLTMDQDTDYMADEIKKMQVFINSRTKGKAAIYCANYRKIYWDERGKEICGPLKIKNNAVKSVIYSMTSGSFYDVDILSNMLPFPDLFIGMVDLDISFLCLERGYKILLVGRSYLSQRVGETIRNSIIRRKLRMVVLSATRYYYLGRNSEYIRKHHGKKFAILMRIMQMRILFNLIVFEKDKRQKLEMWNKGVHEAQHIGAL